MYLSMNDDDGVDMERGSSGHLVVVPLMAQGHMIPMADLSLLLASRGARVSLITTPVNAVRLRSVAEQAKARGLSLELVELALPCAAAGLPEGCENVDLIPSPALFLPFFKCCYLLAAGLRAYLLAQARQPTCMISDQCMPWTAELAAELGIPRFVFHGPSCFYLLCTLNLARHNLYDTIQSEAEAFAVPELPHRIEVTKRTAQRFFDWPGMQDIMSHVRRSEDSADGLVLNTFRDLERFYVRAYARRMGKKVWPVGPVSLFHKHSAVRGNGDACSDNDAGVLQWLQGRDTGSVLFVSFGSIARTRLQQMVEIGCGLEAAGAPFVWAVKQAEQMEEVDAWLTDFTDRNAGRGLVLKGWVPQVMILTHAAVGGFMTHCGWNSALEGVAAGVPMVTWPHFADQFLNAKLVVEVLRTGVGIRVKLPTFYQEAAEEAVVGRDEVERAVKSVMGGGGEQVEQRKKRAKQLGQKARRAMEEGGSSFDSLTHLIDHALKLAGTHQS